MSKWYTITITGLETLIPDGSRGDPYERILRWVGRCPGAVHFDEIHIAPRTPEPLVLPVDEP